MTGEFSVHQFFPNGANECVAQLVDAESAVLTAKDYIGRPAARAGLIRRVIITDGGDCTCFEWKYGQGIVFPKVTP